MPLLKNANPIFLNFPVYRKVQLLWQAARPKTLSAAVVPIIVGTALASFDQYAISCLAVFSALTSALFIQIGTNLFNDAIDFEKGADTEKRIGPQRITQSGFMSAIIVKKWAALCFAISAFAALPIVWIGGWPIVLIGVLSLLFGYLYTGGPYPLAYKGLGDLFVMLFFGIVAVSGTYYLHGGVFSFSSLVAGIQIGCTATALIAINNFRDMNTDRSVGKMTLAARFGTLFSRLEITALFLIAVVLGIYWWEQGAAGAAILPLFTVVFIFRVLPGIWIHDPSPKFNHYLHLTSLAHISLAVLLSIGLCLS